MMFLKYRLVKAYWKAVHAKTKHHQSFTMKTHSELCKARANLHYLSLRCDVIENIHIQNVLFEDTK